MVAECKHGMMEGTCSLCLRPKARRRELTKAVRVIQSRFGSRCGWCGEAIDVGDRIGLFTDEWADEWVHVEHFDE